MNLGDRFVCYGTQPNTIGTIVKMTEKIQYDLRNGVKVIKVMITDEKGNVFDANDCLRVKEPILPSFIKRLKRLF